MSSTEKDEFLKQITMTTKQFSNFKRMYDDKILSMSKTETTSYSYKAKLNSGTNQKSIKQVTEFERKAKDIQETLSKILKTSNMGSPIVKRGEASLTDFRQGKCDLWSWNINGINACANKGELQNFFYKYNPTVFCVNETKLQLKNLDGRFWYA